MGRPKKNVVGDVTVTSPETVTMTVNVNPIPTKIDFLSVDYGREDINNIAKKINEVVERLNEIILKING